MLESDSSLAESEAVNIFNFGSLRIQNAKSHISKHMVIYITHVTQWTAKMTKPNDAAIIVDVVLGFICVSASQVPMVSVCARMQQLLPDCRYR